MIGSRQWVHINSNNRLTGTHDDFSIEVKFDHSKGYDRIVMANCLIPKSFYIVPTDSTFLLSEGVDDIDIEVPVGNYTRRSFASTIGSLLNDNSPNGYSYDISFNNSITQGDTGKYTFDVSNNSGVQPILTFNETLYEQFGFDANSSNQFSSDTLDSANVIKLQAEDNIFIVSDICDNQNDRVLQVVYPNAGIQPFSNVYYQCPDWQLNSKILNTNNSNVFHFRLTNENFQSLALNGQNFTATLVFYKEQPIFELLQHYIGMIFSKELNKNIALAEN